MRPQLHRFNSSFTAIILTLFGFGILMIYSGNHKLAFQQLLFGIIGFVVFSLLRQVDYRVYKNIAPHLYFLSIFLLLLIFIVGTEVKGSTRWFDLGIFRFQPSELVKPLLIIVMSTFITQKDMTRVKNYVISLIVMVLPIFLVFQQPDLGNSLILVSIWVSIIFISQTKMLYLVLTTICSLSILPVFYLFLEQYQKNRLVSFLDPNLDPLGIGYSVIQSQIAIGSGQIFGRGFGRGTQSHLQFLPEFNTDFIFATLSEELGFAGAVIVLFLFAFLIFYLFRLAFSTQDQFASSLAIAVGFVLLVHVAINIGMNIGLLPVTGITLPLVSYGGSSLISIFIMLGIIASIERYSIKGS